MPFGLFRGKPPATAKKDISSRAGPIPVVYLTHHGVIDQFLKEFSGCVQPIDFALVSSGVFPTTEFDERRAHQDADALQPVFERLYFRTRGHRNVEAAVATRWVRERIRGMVYVYEPDRRNEPTNAVTEFSFDWRKTLRNIEKARDDVKGAGLEFWCKPTGRGLNPEYARSWHYDQLASLCDGLIPQMQGHQFRDFSGNPGVFRQRLGQLASQLNKAGVPYYPQVSPGIPGTSRGLRNAVPGTVAADYARAMFEAGASGITVQWEKANPQEVHRFLARLGRA